MPDNLLQFRGQERALGSLKGLLDCEENVLMEVTVCRHIFAGYSLTQ